MERAASGMQVIGITGGTGSGKSEAARRFEELGYPVIDADRIGHDVLEPGGEAAPAVVAAFGQEILCAGQIDRKKLGARIFAEPEARQQLNAITHPCIKREIKRRIKALAAQGHRTVLLDAALIAESGMREPCLDGLILVTCPESVRLQRLMKARGLSQDEAMARMRAQTPPDQKLALADWVLDNEGSVADLRRQVDHLARELKDRER
ncbi:MAG TPA: dephospho-CoA kinase [Candidatus Hydrogenedentes bacterium]|nr:dephospho-CoA kinase [Candidatus Hydrogenedentota bacterium]